MAGKSDYLENAILDAILGGGSWTKPGTVYVALFSATPSDAGGGTELSGSGYARKAVTNDATNWPNAVGGAKANGVEIRFAAASAGWTTAVAWGIFDASSGGNLLYWGPLTVNRTVASGNEAVFPAGDLDVTED
jgi:hypothetical protein